jgi:membrane protein DedA with SNARE-associated domain
MSFGLFIASGSFFLGQMKFIPEPIRIVPLIVILAVSPLVILLYWMWRVRLKQNLRGMMPATPIEVRRTA